MFVVHVCRAEQKITWHNAFSNAFSAFSSPVSVLRICATPVSHLLLKNKASDQEPS